MPEWPEQSMPPMGQAEEPMDDELRQKLEEVRQKLMHLHKALLDYERTHYESAFGRVATSGEMLQLVIHDRWFAWLHPMSNLIVRIDESLDWLDPGTAREGKELIEYTRSLLSPSEKGDAFAGNYLLALQREPAVVMAHAEVRRALAGRG